MYVLAAAASLSIFGLVFFAVVFTFYLASRVRGTFQRWRDRPRVSRVERERTRELIAARLAREVGGTVSVFQAADAEPLSPNAVGTCPKCQATRIPGFHFCRSCGYRWEDARTVAEPQARIAAPSAVAVGPGGSKAGRPGQRLGRRVRAQRPRPAWRGQSG